MGLNKKLKFSLSKFQHYCEFEWNLKDDFYENAFDENILRSPAFFVDDDCTIEYRIILNNKYWNEMRSINIRLETSEKNLKNINVKFSYEFTNLISGKLEEGFVENFLAFKSGVDAVLHNCSKCCPTDPDDYMYDDWCYMYDYWEFSSNDCELLPSNQWFKARLEETYSQLEYSTASCYYGLRVCTCDVYSLHGRIFISNCQIKHNTTEISEEKCVLQLQTDFKSLLKNHDLTDIALNVGKEIIGAHKFVLCARSPVFRRMFEQDFKEVAPDSIDIKGMERTSLEAFLEFLYTGVVACRKFETISAMYSAAHKYEVQTLQEVCREILIPYLSSDKAPIILKLSDMHNDSDLREKSMVFICDNFVKVQQTAEWGNLLDTDPRLVSRVLRRVSAKNSKC